MPRVSEDAKMVTPPPEAITADPPAPPAHLREPEAAEWRAIIERMGPAWLPREAHALLEAFVSIKVQAQTVNEALAAFGSEIPEDRQRWQRFKELTSMRGQLAGQLATLATKLRLTPQSRYDRHAAGNAARRRVGRPPWAPVHDDAMCG